MKAEAVNFPSPKDNGLVNTQNEKNPSGTRHDKGGSNGYKPSRLLGFHKIIIA